ncbi:carboxypeptidase-like regulatory domain-containing protein [Vibrio kasasachensis]|uniref:carboxypeptidase-like regulatory domain-containing protein n=1 Tax=Vibrio kasasachensis TaxID=2910248 RepID=UPI003D134BB1
MRHVVKQNNVWLLFLLVISQTLFAQSFFPAHIEVETNESSEDFYRVIMDDDESPYLKIDNLALYQLGMIGECRSYSCQFYLPNDINKENPPYEIDLLNKQCNQATKEYSTIKTVNFEEQILVHWRSIGQCLPVKLNWYLLDYKLHMDKGFKTLADLEKQIKKMKKSSRDQALELSSRKRQPVHLPSDGIGLSTRFSTSITYNETGYKDLYVLSDSMFSTQNTLSQLSLDSSQSEPVNYYSIAAKTNQGEGTLEIGHVFLDGGIFTNNEKIENGLYYTNRVTSTGFGNIQLQNSTKPNIEVDLLINGIYRSSYRSDAFGRFTIDEDNISPGDTLTFRYYLGEGLWAEEELTVAGIDSDFLPKGEWLTEVTYNGEDGKTGALSAEYGIDDYITIGASFFSLEEQHQIGLQTQLLPAHWMSALVGWLPGQDRWPIQLNMQFSRYQSMSVELNRSHSLEIDDIPYHSLKYSWNNPLFAFNTSAEYDENGYDINPRLGIRIGRSLYFNYQPKYEYSFLNETSHSTHYFELTSSGLADISWSISSSVDYSGRHEQSSARIRSDCSDSCWLAQFGLFEDLSTSIQLQYHDDELDYHASLSASINPYLSMSLNGNEDSYELTLTTEFAGKTNFSADTSQFTYWDEYSYGTVKGKVTDQDGNPIADVRLQLLNQYVETNENGEYQFDRVPARKELAIKINQSTLDLSLVPEHNPVLLDTREIATTEVDIVLISSFGIDGFIEANIEDKAFIYFKHLQKQDEYASVVEQDGFYVVEGLIDGHYMITLEIGEREYVMSKKIDGDFWISGMDFTLDDFEANRQLAE